MQGVEEDPADPRRVLRKPLALENGDVGEGHRAAHGMPRVGEPMHEGSIRRELDQLLEQGAPQHDRREGEVSARDPFRHHHDVWNHTPPLHAEEGPQPPEAGDHFIGDDQDAVPATDLKDLAQVVLRGHDDPARALDRFGDKRRDGLGTLPLDGALQLLGAPAGAFRGGHPLCVGVRG